MSGDKRSVSTDALETLGSIIDEHAGRDAIHVAVEPVQAGEDLRPGQDVGIAAGCAWGYGPFVGIVDPFLKSPVQPGEYFWLLVYPRTITSLRHVWSHPAFEDKEPAAVAAPDKAESEQWLMDFCNGCYGTCDPPDYKRLMQALEDYDENYGDDYLTIHGIDASGEIPDELWYHAEIVTGKKFKKRATYFSCSC